MGSGVFPGPAMTAATGASANNKNTNKTDRANNRLNPVESFICNTSLVETLTWTAVRTLPWTAGQSMLLYNQGSDQRHMEEQVACQGGSKSEIC